MKLKGCYASLLPIGALLLVGFEDLNEVQKYSCSAVLCSCSFENQTLLHVYYPFWGFDEDTSFGA
jgi:hypothetical protein